MKCSTKILHRFLLLYLFFHLPVFSAEDDAKDDPSIFTSEQLSGLTSDEDHLIGGLISPLSGNPCLRQTDFTVHGAQEILLSRVYLSPYMPHSFHKHWDADCYYRGCYLARHYEGWKFFPHTLPTLEKLETAPLLNAMDWQMDWDLRMRANPSISSPRASVHLISKALFPLAQASLFESADRCPKADLFRML